MAKHRGGLALAITAILLLALAFVLPAMPRSADAAPQLAVTPVAAGKAAAPNAQPRLVTFFSARGIAADTTSPCVYIGDAEKATVYWNVDIGATVNTTTLTMKMGNTLDAVVSQLNPQAATAVDVSGLQEFAVYGQYACLLADVTNTGLTTVTANAWVK